MNPGEKGAALVTVLVLVAVIGAIAASALERLRFATALATNGAALDQARGYAAGIELLVGLQIDDLLARDTGAAPLAAQRTRTITLPDGVGEVVARIDEGANCFNLNSLVRADREGALRGHPVGISQFEGLMTAAGVPEGRARQVAAAATDWIDSDGTPLPGGAEDAAYGAAGFRTANRLFADASELRAVSEVDGMLYDLLRPLVCALPVTDLSPVNVNALTREQAPLLSMVAPTRIPVDVARAAIAARPAGGWRSVQAFWNSPALTDRFPGTETASQFAVRPQWVRLEIEGRFAGAELFESALIDARRTPSRVVSRSWGRDR